jgi:hypothetical protein
MANQMIVNLVNYTNTLEARLKLYEDDDAEVTSLFINNFLDREKLVEEEYKRKSVYFNLLKCRVIKRKQIDASELCDHLREAYDSVKQDLESSEEKKDYFESIVDLTTNKTLMAVISQWNIDVLRCRLPLSSKKDRKIKPVGYKSGFSEYEFISGLSANIEDSFGELEHNIRIAYEIDNNHYNYIDLDEWEIIIKLLEGLQLLDFDDFLECFDYDDEDVDKYKKAIKEKDMEVLEEDFPNMMYEILEVNNENDHYIICFNE